jgi:circadian clock protein KaiC
MARKSTGVKELDELVEGGLKEGSINLVAGESGTGKSILATQFILAGIASGEPGLYLSIEEKKPKFFENMKALGLNLEEMEAGKKFVFYEAKPNEIRNFLNKGLLGFEEHIRDGKVKRIVVDSISALLLLFEGETTQREALLVLMDKLSRWGLTVLMTSEVEFGQSRFNIDYIVDTILRLYYKKVGKERVRTLEILKMRGTKHDKREIMYRIEKGGIKLYPREGVL